MYTEILLSSSYENIYCTPEMYKIHCATCGGSYVGEVYFTFTLQEHATSHGVKTELF